MKNKELVYIEVFKCRTWYMCMWIYQGLGFKNNGKEVDMKIGRNDLEKVENGKAMLYLGVWEQCKG